MATSPKLSPGPRRPRSSPCTLTTASPLSITKKRETWSPSATTASPGAKVCSLKDPLRRLSSFGSSSAKSGTCCSSSTDGAATSEFLHGRDAEPRANHRVGRLRAARVAGDGGEEVVAVERKQGDVGRC